MRVWMLLSNELETFVGFSLPLPLDSCSSSRSPWPRAGELAGIGNEEMDVLLYYGFHSWQCEQDFCTVDRYNRNKTEVHVLVSVWHISGVNTGIHNSHQVWPIRLRVYSHRQTGAHSVASADLGCIQKHSGACESPKASNRRPTDSFDPRDRWVWTERQLQLWTALRRKKNKGRWFVPDSDL